jgi:hypothetical protein
LLVLLIVLGLRALDCICSDGLTGCLLANEDKLLSRLLSLPLARLFLFLRLTRLFRLAGFLLLLRLLRLFRLAWLLGFTRLSLLLRFPSLLAVFYRLSSCKCSLLALSDLGSGRLSLPLLL